FLWREGSHWAKVGARKAILASDLCELQTAYDCVSQVTPEVMLQEWVPGDTSGIVVWGGYIDKKRRPVQYFTARKLMEMPERCGTGCVIKAEPIPELTPLSARLCEALNYTGLAEIEYKQDSRDGVYKLIEINPRHWDWHELGTAVGVNLSFAAYSDTVGLPVQSRGLSNDQAKWVAEDSFVVSALESVYRDIQSLPQIMSLISGDRLLSIFRWYDPIPFLRFAATEMTSNVFSRSMRVLRRDLWGRHNLPKVARSGAA